MADSVRRGDDCVSGKINWLKIQVLGSGSGGNATVVSSGATRVMVDAGFRLRALEQRCRGAGVEPAQLSAIFVTHEHTDHQLGALDFADKYNLPIFCSRGTAQALGLDGSLFASYTRLEAGKEFVVGDLGVRAFATPHDANESLAYRFEDARSSCAIATDLGHCDATFVDFLRRVDALFFEFNHDEEMLRDGPYHWSLKKRISGGFGHLSNRQSAEALSAVAWPGLREVIALHLSRQNNDPVLVRAQIAETLARAESDARFGCANQASGHEAIEV